MGDGIVDSSLLLLATYRLYEYETMKRFNFIHVKHLPSRHLYFSSFTCIISQRRFRELLSDSGSISAAFSFWRGNCPDHDASTKVSRSARCLYIEDLGLSWVPH